LNHIIKSVTSVNGEELMQHSEFEIGKIFYIGADKFRVTDVGQRTVIAIKLTNVRKHDGATTTTMTEEQAEKEGWFNGPPYPIVEHVLDEDDIEMCSLTEVAIA
jgi:hypothetical protein